MGTNKKSRNGVARERWGEAAVVVARIGGGAMRPEFMVHQVRLTDPENSVMRESSWIVSESYAIVPI